MSDFDKVMFVERCGLRRSSGQMCGWRLTVAVWTTHARHASSVYKAERRRETVSSFLRFHVQCFVLALNNDDPFRVYPHYAKRKVNLLHTISTSPRRTLNLLNT